MRPQRPVITYAAATAAALLAAATAFVGSASPANAHNWFGNTGSTGCSSPNMADNTGQNYQYTALNQVMSDATTWARTNDIDPTRVDTWIDQTPDQHTDVLVTDAYYHTLCGLTWVDGDTPNGTVGYTTCEHLTSVGNCDQHLVRYDNYFTDTATTASRRGLACHENGHALGLAHPEPTGDPASCMSQGYPKPMNYYSNHDITMLNNL